MFGTRTRLAAVAAAGALAVGGAVGLAPTAHANTLQLELAALGLSVQVRGDEIGATGPAALVKTGAALGHTLGLGSIELFDGANESGYGIVVFNAGQPFRVVGDTFVNMANNTSTNYDISTPDNNHVDASVAPGQDNNIPATDAAIAPLPTLPAGYSYQFPINGNIFIAVTITINQ